MNRTAPISRREFSRQSALAAAALAASVAPVIAAPVNPWKIIAFSKPFDRLSPDETADIVAEIGWDGIECAVRKKMGHIAPERVEEDLPKMAEALKKRGKTIEIVTTEITKLDPIAEKIIRTCAKLGIKKYRFGFAKYTEHRPIPDTVREQGAALKELGAFNRELGVQGGWQNHSGANYIGAPVWDLWTMMRDLDPKHVGVCFDIAHATIEGGLSWPIQAQLIEPWYAAVYLKDFRWEKTEKGWQPLWCNFGEGAVQRSFLTNLKTGKFAGPLSQHHEYKDLGTGAQMIANMKKDLAKLREWLA